MKKTGLQEDQDVYVEIKGNNEGVYETKILDIEGNQVKIVAPEADGVPIPMSRGQKITVSYTTERGKFFFVTRIEDRGSKPLPFYLLERPQKIYRVQRREYVRVEISGRIDYRPRPEEGDEEEEEFAQGQLRDLSGGGARFQGTSQVEEGQELELKIPILELDQPLWGIVRRQREKKKGVYEIGIAFVDIDPNVREDIIKWLFEYQRHMRGGADEK